MASLNPRNHPNAFMSFSSGNLTGLVLYEIQVRGGVHLALVEQAFIVAFVSALALALGTRSGLGAPVPDASVPEIPPAA